MPPRWFCLLIVAAWLAFTGFLFWHDLLPQLLPGQPPPYALDLVEEARTVRTSTSWTLSQNGREVCIARTRIDHPQRGVFEMIADYPIKGRLVVGPLNVHAFSTTYRIDGAGHLLGFEARFQATPEALGGTMKTDLFGDLTGKFAATLTGDIEGQRLTLVRELIPGTGAPLTNAGLAELAVGRGGAVLLPLHPVKRLRGISPGQSWRTVVADPFDLLFAGQPRVVRAKVRPVVEAFIWEKRKEEPCLVIDYEGERVKITVWVSHETGNVLCQEATLDRTTWAMVRQ